MIDASPVWDGRGDTADRIIYWCGLPGRINKVWAGMQGWRLSFSTTPGGMRHTLRLGDRIAREDDTDGATLWRVSA